MIRFLLVVNVCSTNIYGSSLRSKLLSIDCSYCFRYSIDGRYTDDERMLIIWDKLAENSLGHGYEVYQHAYSVGSLLR